MWRERDCRISGCSGRMKIAIACDHGGFGLKDRRTEIEAFNGAAVREGRALGIPMPYNDALALMVKARNVHEMSRREPRRE